MKTAHIENESAQVIAFRDSKGNALELPSPVSIAEADGLDFTDSDVATDAKGRPSKVTPKPKEPKAPAEPAEPEAPSLAEQETRLADGLAAALGS